MKKTLVALLAAAPAAALAGGYSVPNVNPRDLSMSGSLVAAQDTAAAAFANPAALARVQGLNLSLAISGIDFKSSWSDPANLGLGAPVSGDTNIAIPPALYASWGARLPNDMRYGVGVGFTVPFGGNVFWPDTWPGATDIVTVDRRVYGTYLSAAVEPIPWLRVGGAFIWYRGTEKLSQRVGQGTPADSTGTLATSGNGYSYDVSAEIQPIEPLRIGIDYKHKSTLGLEGHASWSGTPPVELAPLTLDQTVKHQLTVPNTLGIGAAFQATPALLVTGSFTWERFRVYDEDAFIGGAGAQIIVPRNYTNGYTFRLGAELAPIEKLKVRAGVLRDVAPTPAEWLSPTIPDSNVWAGSIGAGYEIFRGLTVEAAYFHAFFDQVTTPRAADGTYNVFPGTYDTRANILSIGVTWAVPVGPQRSDARP
jgi:long-chain fatty acid transport protein